MVKTEYGSLKAMLCTVALALPGAAVAVTADNVACDGCVHKPDIADQAVTKSKIRKNAVTSGRIRNNTIRAVDVRDEPGIEFSRDPVGGVLGANLEDTILDDSSMTIPRPGYVSCSNTTLLSAGPEVAGEQGQLAFTWLLNGASPGNSAIEEIDGLPEGLSTVNNHQVFEVTSGTHNLVLLVERFQAVGIRGVSALNVVSACHYFPTRY